MPGSVHLSLSPAPSSAPGMPTSSPNTPSARLARLLTLFARIEAVGIATQFITPRIVVAGDQSAGKSSVIQALSSAPVQVGQSTTTRSPLEVLFVKREREGWQAFVKPCPGVPVPAAMQTAIDVFNATKWQDRGTAEQALLEAKKVLGVETAGFSRHLVSFHIHGPNVQPFCYVDTPGLVRSVSNEEEAAEKRATVQILRDCINRDLVIILAVISCQQEWNNHEVQAEIYRANKKAQAMLVASKPDKIDEDETVKQGQYFGAVQSQTNGDYGYGAHMVRSLGPGDIQRNLQGQYVDRDAAEAEFFRHEKFGGIRPEHLGIPALAVRLESGLLAVSEARLRGIHSSIERDLDVARSERQKLAESARVYSIAAVQEALPDVAGLFNDALTGASENPHLILRGAAADSSPLLLATHLQERLSAFAEEVVENGHRWTITRGSREEGTHASSPAVSTVADDVETVDVQVIVDRAKEYLTRTARVPTNFDAALATCLFTQQAGKWRGLVGSLVADVVKMARDCLEATLQCITRDPGLGEVLFKLVGEGAIEGLARSLHQLSTPGLHAVRTGQLVMEFDVRAWEAIFLGRLDELESMIDRETRASRKLMNVRQCFNVLRQRQTIKANLQRVSCREGVSAMEMQYRIERDLLLIGFSLATIQKQMATCVVEHLRHRRPSAEELEKAITGQSGERQAAGELRQLDEKIAELEDIERELLKVIASGPAQCHKRRAEESEGPGQRKAPRRERA